MTNYNNLGGQNQTNHQESSFRVPIGTVFPWAGTGGAAIPTGYVLCDGSAYLIATYPALYSAIGTGAGNGSFNNAGAGSGFAGGTAFNVPDMRGKFIRGADNMSGPSGARGLDDTATNGRFAAAHATGSPAGVNSFETDQFQSHWHNMYALIELNGSDHGISGAIGAPTIDSGYQARDVASDPSYGTAQVTNETRPINSSVVFIIRAY
jgi:microcystin-dependent protein